MKILLVNKYLYPRGGDAISTIITGNLLQKKGHQVLFWGMAHPDNPPYSTSSYFVDHVDYEGSCGFKKQIKAAANLLYSFEAKTKIEKLIHEEKPDIVHLNNFAHQISPSILDTFKKHGIPAVMTMRDYKLVCPVYTMLFAGKPCEKCKGGGFYWCFLRRCTKDSYIKSALNVLEMYLHHKVFHIYDKIDILISPSVFLKEKVTEMGLNRKIFYVPNFVEMNESKTSYQWEKNKVTYVGRLSEEKGLLTLINAVKGLDVQLEIIGEGPQKAELENQLIKEKIKNIHFSGYIQGRDLYEKVRNSMFLIIPSEWYENNPRTIIEAFALGKTVIGSNIGGIPELIKDRETGLLFTPGDHCNLKMKIQWLINNPEAIVSMGKNARKFLVNELNPERHYQTLIGIYKMAMEKAGKPIKN